MIDKILGILLIGAMAFWVVATLTTPPVKADYGDQAYYKDMVTELKGIRAALEKLSATPPPPLPQCRNKVGAAVPCSNPTQGDRLPAERP